MDGDIAEQEIAGAAAWRIGCGKAVMLERASADLERRLDPGDAADRLPLKCNAPPLAGVLM